MADLRKMKLLQWLVKLGSIQRASQEAGLTRQAASQIIQNLEIEYSIKIVERLSNKLFVTDEGRALALLFDDFIEKAERLQVRQLNELVILSSHAIIADLIPPMLPRLKAKHDVKIKMIGDDEGRKENQMRCDIFIGPDRVLEHETEKVLLPCDKSLKFFAHPSYIRKKGRPRTIEELDNHDLIVFNEGENIPMGLAGWPLYVGRGFDEDWREPSIVANSIGAMIRATQQGLGLVALSSEKAASIGGLVPVLENICGTNADTYIQFSKKSPKKKLIADCVLELTNALQQQNPAEVQYLRAA